MEAIRRIQTVHNGEVHFQLPKQFWGQEVEIIVLPAPAQTMRLVMPKKSLRGCLNRNYSPKNRTHGKQRRVKNMDALNTAHIAPEWRCLEFLNGHVDIDPKTLYRYVCTDEAKQAA